MLILAVEGMPGNTVQGMAQDMIDLACRLNVMVKCTINGVEVLATRGMEMALLQHQYEEGLATVTLPPDGESVPPILRISTDAARYWGYFVSAESSTPAYDPGITAQCPICYRLLIMEDVRTISVHYAAQGSTASELSCFYRVHKSCHDRLAGDEQAAIEHQLMDLLPEPSSYD